MNAGQGAWLDTPIARHIWNTRYRWIGEVGAGERDIESTWRRVARAAAAPEAARSTEWESRFYAILEGFRFLPAGRILAGAGTGRSTTLFNCFVMGPVEDDLYGIFEALKEGAVTMQAGGGVGYDFSTLRPQGCRARTSGRIASGPVSFLQVWDAMCATVLSTGARRGAMIASLRCDHPDMLDFVDAKRQPGRLSHFNLSVQVTAALLEAVDRNSAWPLVFPAAGLGAGPPAHTVQRDWPGFEGPVACRIVRQLPARELWDRIVRAAYESAEPGVLFIDRINWMNNLYWREIITTTNPCGEVPLPPYGACNLGSLNLTRFVRDPFTDRAALDLDALRDTAATAVRFLDNIIDCSEFPLPQQAAQARGSRRIGLGMTGLADALMMLGRHYGSSAARRTASQAMQIILHTAYRTSIELARDKWAFPFFEAAPFLAGQFVQSLPADIVAGIGRHGLRNSHLTAIAPAGTISLLAGNVSSGIEPVFDFRVRRRVLDRDGGGVEFELEDFALAAWKQQGHAAAALPPYFVTALALSPEQHLDMQAALQPHVDSAISKTINVPEDMPYEDFRQIYRKAHELGLKGCTVYRPNRLRGAVLHAVAGAKSDELPASRDANVHCCPFERQGD
jgi:ribonucleoside-diphosphate reductase alpha chain